MYCEIGWELRRGRAKASAFPGRAWELERKSIRGLRRKNIPDELKRYSERSFEDKYKRLDWNKPSWTLTAHMQKDCLAYIHPTQIRSIFVREAARLQSFPDHFVFDAPMTKMFELVGNSVPPLLAEAIAKPIVKQVQAYYEAQSERG